MSKFYSLAFKYKKSGVFPDFSSHKEKIMLLAFLIISRTERVMGLEPTISCLGSKRSTTELHPHGGMIIPVQMSMSRLAVQEEIGQLK